jgi:hypothetical protein
MRQQASLFSNRDCAMAGLQAIGVVEEFMLSSLRQKIVRGKQREHFCELRCLSLPPLTPQTLVVLVGAGKTNYCAVTAIVIDHRPRVNDANVIFKGPGEGATFGNNKS